MDTRLQQFIFLWGFLSNVTFALFNRITMFGLSLYLWLVKCPRQALVTQVWAGRRAAAWGQWWTRRWSPSAAAAAARWSCSIEAGSAASPAFPCSLVCRATSGPAAYSTVSKTSDTQTQSLTPSATPPPKRWWPVGCWGGWCWLGQQRCL